MSRAARVLVVLLAALRPQPRAVLPALWALVLAAGFAWPEGAFAQVSCVGEPMLPLEFGDGMLYRANQTPDDEITFVQFGSEMRFLANTTSGIDMTWTAKDFDDSDWSTGEYGTGYDTGAAPNALALIDLDATVAPHSYSVFTRVTFAISDVGTINQLFLGADYDDGFAAWINGVEVLRSPELPGGTLAWNTNAALHESSNAATPNYGTMFDISGGIPLLVPGTNVLAIGVWNSAAPTSTDLVLVPRLTAAPNWTLPSFTPSSAWLTGSYGVGYETATSGGAQNLILTPVPDHTTSVFTRSTFCIPDTGTVGKLFIHADYDDGYVAYINGVEVLGSNEMPSGRLAWNSLAGPHESSNGTVPDYGFQQDISARGIPALRNGNNVLAVGVWNRASALESTDLVLVPRLTVSEDDACDGSDNDADGTIDEGFPDFDGDGFADCVDLDDDNDSAADTFDCAPLDPLNSAPPILEVRNVLYGRGPVRNRLLTLQNQGFGVVYDVAGGLISQLRVDGGVSGATCVPGGNDLANATFDDTRPDPPVGDGYYYIVRAQKPSCGTGGYGLSSSGVPRQPTPNDCP